jgi:hypothetical protein
MSLIKQKLCGQLVCEFFAEFKFDSKNFTIDFAELNSTSAQERDINILGGFHEHQGGYNDNVVYLS